MCVAEHAELIALIEVVNGKVDQVLHIQETMQATLATKVDGGYCVDRCQKRWVSRQYFAGGLGVGGFFIGVLAFYHNIQELMMALTKVK